MTVANGAFDFGSLASNKANCKSRRRSRVTSAKQFPAFAVTSTPFGSEPRIRVSPCSTLASDCVDLLHVSSKEIIAHDLRIEAANSGKGSNWLSDTG